jgi:ribose transport system substrate-binding protein
MKTLRFLVSLHNCDNDFQVAQAQSAESTGRKLGIDLQIVYAEDDAVNQSTQLLKAIQAATESRPNAIVLEPVSAMSLPRVAGAACAAGVGWAVLNRRPEYLPDLRKRATAPVFAVSVDHEEIGRIQGKQLSALLPRGGAVLYIQGPSSSSSARKRTEGMLQTKPPNIGISTLKANWTEESAKRAVLSWLRLSTSQTTRIDLVAAQDDAMAIGARKAFQQLTNDNERGRWLSVPFTGCDGQPETGQAWVQEKLLAATIYISPLTGTAIETLVDAIRRGIQPSEYILTMPASIPALNVLSPFRPFEDAHSKNS